jgi:hypothetical protein
VHRIFERNEAIDLRKAALASGPMNNRQLAQYVMKAKGLDTGDKVFAKSRGVAAHSCAAPAVPKGRTCG